MRRDVGLGVFFGALIVGSAGVYFFRANRSASDLVVLESFTPQPAPAAEPPPATHSRVAPTQPPTQSPRHPATPEPPPAQHTPGQPPHPTVEPATPPRHALADRLPTGRPPATEPAADRKPLESPASPPAATTPPTPPPSAAAGGPKPPLIHTVESGESLSQIAQRYYNDASLAACRTIAAANPEIRSLTRIHPGMRLVIPDRAAATRPASASRQSGRAAPRGATQTTDSTASRPSGAASPLATTAHRTYVVRPGDTLYGIAARELGDGSKWKSLRDLNRGVVAADGVTLRVGAVLRLPPTPAAPERR